MHEYDSKGAKGDLGAREENPDTHSRTRDADTRENEKEEKGV